MQQFFKLDGILSIRKADGNVVVLVGAIPIYRYRREDELARRLILAQLSIAGVADVRLEKLFETGRTQVRHYRRVFEKDGVAGLAELRRRGRPKMAEEIKSYVRAMFEGVRGLLGYQKILRDEVKALFGKELPRSSLQQILKEEIRDHEKPARKGREKSGRREEKRVGLGNLLLLPLIERSGVLGILEKALGKVRGGYYEVRDVVLTLLVAVTMGGAINEEQLKGLDVLEMGALLGRKRMPSVKTIRRMVPQMIDGLEYKKLVRKLARSWIKREQPEPVFYVDGHFVPYYGKEKTLKGYHTVRRLVTKGRTQYFVHETDGYPLLFVLSDGYEGFRHYLPGIARFVRDCYPDRRKEITLVFDRGAYGEESLERLGRQVSYICWKAKGKLPVGEVKWTKVTVDHASNTWGETEPVNTEATEKKKRKEGLRDFWIRRGDKISPAVTNDMTTPLKEIVRRLVRRWGAQENGFKILKEKGIDGISSYRTEEWDTGFLVREGLERGKVPQREVDNPVVTQLKKKGRELRKVIGKLERRAGKKVLQAKAKGRKTTKPLSRKEQQKLHAHHRILKRVQARIARLPEKVKLFDDVIQAKGIRRLASEKKTFLDVIKMLAVQFEKDFISLVGPLYRNNRDVRDYCLRVLNLRGQVVRKNGKEKVILQPMNTKQETKVLRALCAKINEIALTARKGRRSTDMVFAVKP